MRIAHIQQHCGFFVHPTPVSRQIASGNLLHPQLFSQDSILQSRGQRTRPEFSKPNDVISSHCTISSQVSPHTSLSRSQQSLVSPRSLLRGCREESPSSIQAHVSQASEDLKHLQCSLFVSPRDRDPCGTSEADRGASNEKVSISFKFFHCHASRENAHAVPEPQSFHLQNGESNCASSAQLNSAASSVKATILIKGIPGLLAL